MKTVLIIGSDFIPSSLPPATRIRFFAKHLQEFGWQPVVLSTKPEYYEWAVDNENVKLLPASVEIVRTKALSARITRKLGVGDIGMRTAWHHWQAIKRICRERKIDLIFIPVPPSVPMILGRMAHRKFGIPYVIDYIDPWVTDAYKNVPRNQRPPKWLFADTLSRVLEPFALRDVAHITGVSRGTTDSVVKRYSWLNQDDATEIPYGAEADDFAYIRKQPRKNPIFDPTDGLFHMSYVGACIPGMHPAVRALFQAVRAGLDRMPEKFGRLRLHFVGTSYAANGNALHSVVALACEAGIESQVDELPKRISYLDSLQVMLDSNALFLIGSDQPHYTASKVFPYLLAQRPLVSIFHEGSSVNHVLKEVGIGQSVTFSTESPPSEKVEGIYLAVQHALAQTREINACDALARLEPYTTRAMAQRLAESFNRATLPDSEMTGPVAPSELLTIRESRGKTDSQQRAAGGGLPV